MIHLVDKIGTGTERDVYIHPDNDCLVIKINRREATRDINKLEYDYYQRRIVNTALAPYFPQMLGWQETSLGRGLVTDCIRDGDGRISRNLAEAIEQRMIRYAGARQKIVMIARAAIEHGLIMREFDVVNVLIRLKEKGDFDVVVVDGFGPLATGMKNALRLKFPVLSRIKARKSWKKQIALLDAWAERGHDPANDSDLVRP